nr:MAG TPA: hypothetical protein [Caudoviricetes sp.]
MYFSIGVHRHISIISSSNIAIITFNNRLFSM